MVDKSTEIILSILDQIKTSSDKTKLRLPTEAEMCVKYEANRTVVRRALEILQYFKVIKGIRGSGYVVTFDSSDFADTAAKLLNLYHFDFKDISDVREALELKVVALIQKETCLESELEYLQNCVNTMKLGGSDAVIADQNFHDKLAKMSGNQLIMAITDAIGRYTKRYMEEYWSIDEKPHGTAKASLTEAHQEVLDIIISKKAIKINDNPITRHYKLSCELISPTLSVESTVASELTIGDLIKRGWSSDKIAELAKSLEHNNNNN